MKSSKWTAADIADQTGRVAIVTGGNSGIGYETVKALAQKGATVVMASRSATRGQSAVDALKAELPQANVELMILDLASQQSVKDFAEAYAARYKTLDLLINNAGVMMPPERRETADGFELQFGTNHLGHFTLTALLLDVLSATPGSRIVNVSSSVQNMGGIDLEDLNWTARDFDRMGSYISSKISNMLFTLELQNRLDEAGLDIITTAAHPGWTATNLQQDVWYARLLNPLVAMKPWQGALPTLYAAVSEQATPGGYYGPNGFQTMRGYPAENEPAAPSRDVESARKLWTLSESMVGMTFDIVAPAAA